MTASAHASPSLSPDARAARAGRHRGHRRRARRHGRVAHPRDDPTAATIDTILADTRLDGAQAAVVVVDTTTGQTLYDRNGTAG